MQCSIMLGKFFIVHPLYSYSAGWGPSLYEIVNFGTAGDQFAKAPFVPTYIKGF